MHDAEVHAKQQQARREIAREPEIRRLQLSLNVFETAINIATQLGTRLDEMEELPLVYFLERKAYYEGKRRVCVEEKVVQNLNLFGYASLLKEENEFWNFAILGLHALASRLRTCDVSMLKRFSVNPVHGSATTERLPGESARAFHAYCVYRDLGPDRTIARAWAAEHQKEGASAQVFKSGQRSTRCRSMGHWGALSRRWAWVARAREYDTQVDLARFYSQHADSDRVWIRYADLVLRNQDRIERRADRTFALVLTTKGAPALDIYTRTSMRDDAGKTLVTTTHLKGVNISGLAAVVKQLLETWRQGVVGVLDSPDRRRRPKKPSVQGWVTQRMLDANPIFQN